MQSESRLPLFVFLAATGAYSVTLILLSLARYYGLHSNALDLGSFDQIFWLMLHGMRPFAAFFHFSPILYALLPVYALFPHPETLILLNVLLITSTVFPIYLIARYWGISRYLATAWCMAFLANPFIINGAIFDFHEIAVASPVMGFALYGLVARKRTMVFVTSFLLLLCKEHYGMSVAGIGLLWAVLYRDWRGGMLLACGGLAVLAVVLLFVMPVLSGHAFMDPWNISEGRYTWLFHLSSQTPEFLSMMATGAVVYIATLLIPFWFLPLYGLIWLLPAAGDMAVNLFSAGTFMRVPFTYHNVTTIPAFITAAMSAGLYLVRKRPRLRFIEITTLVVATNFILGYMSAPIPLPGATNLWEIHWSALSNPHAADIRAIQTLLPPGKTVSAQANIGSFFDQRAVMYSFPHIDDSSYIVLHLQHPFRHNRNVFGSPYDTPRYFTVAKLLLRDKSWGVIYWHDHWLVLGKNTPGLNVSRPELEKALDDMHTDYLNASPTLPAE